MGWRTGAHREDWSWAEGLVLIVKTTVEWCSLLLLTYCVSSYLLLFIYRYAVILAFDVKIEKEAQELAESLGVTIFTADIIYHLFDKFTAYRDELKKKKQEEFKHIAVFPCKLRVIPSCIFNSRDPIVCGVAVESGFVKVGTPICVPTKEVGWIILVKTLDYL